MRSLALSSFDGVDGGGRRAACNAGVASDEAEGLRCGSAACRAMIACEFGDVITEDEIKVCRQRVVSQMVSEQQRQPGAMDVREKYY